MCKEYKVNQEIIDLFELCSSLQDAIDRSLKIPFCHRRTVKLIKEESKISLKAWKMAYEIHPEIKKLPKAHYHYLSQTIREGVK